PLLAPPGGKDRQKRRLQSRSVRVPGGIVAEARIVLPLGVAQRLGEAMPRRLAGAGYRDELAALRWVGAVGGEQVMPYAHALGNIALIEVPEGKVAKHARHAVE